MPKTLHTRFLTPYRLAGWGVLGALLLIPAIAMQVSSGVRWTGDDFLFAAVLLTVLGLFVEAAFRVGRGAPHRAGVMIAGLTIFLTAWTTGAVGIFNSDHQPTVIAPVILAAGAALAAIALGLKPAAMQWLAALMAAGQIAMGVLVPALWPVPIVKWGPLVFFAVLWGAAALCFAQARNQTNLA